ncbi:putative bacteriophage tail fiber protein [Pectobacterium atrosepticum]|uniref:phage tail-collar fiber domain-containing protein n=1 Tax=Pectobacterium atrosepticum TaxID=29471 RepID=UPI0004E83887|nr:phage tail protein [Pectobacterium atrosepticum]AIK16063.1 putative bacteriophage tail fiber protein [Pectobacterium atrosepticum]
MSAKYLVLLTNIGAAKLANATALGSRLNITQMAVGDGGGILPTPSPAQLTLINEKRRAAINTLSTDPQNPSQIIAEQVIPENEGGWWIREIGLFDDDGNLIAIANCPETYKPQLQEGSGRIQTVRMILIVSSTDAVTLKIDPSVVLATRSYVDNAIDTHERGRKHPDATLNAKGFVQLSNATNSDSEALAATPRAVKAAVTTANNAATAADNANTNANGRVPSGRTVNGKALTADIALNAVDIGAYTKAETDNQVGTALTAANNANTNANGRVPSGRTVNGKALTADIALNAVDIGAYTKAETDTQVGKVLTAANNANTNANSRVPSGRTVNGKALTADIALSAAEVGALAKDQNGADIPNKPLFLSNINAVSTDTFQVITGKKLLSADDDALTIKPKAQGQRAYIQFNNAASDTAIAFVGLRYGADEQGLTLEHRSGASIRIADGAINFYGLPHGATAPTGTNTTQLASTEFVQNELAATAGMPRPWPRATAPTGWLKCNGQSFDISAFPRLAAAYPAGVLPDLRGEFMRGWDDGRGVDSGRALLSAQSDAIRNIVGEIWTSAASQQFLGETLSSSGVFELLYEFAVGAIPDAAGNSCPTRMKFDAGRTVPTANENRPRNIAFNYIVRAA